MRRLDFSTDAAGAADMTSHAGASHRPFRHVWLRLQLVAYWRYRLLRGTMRIIAGVALFAFSTALPLAAQSSGASGVPLSVDACEVLAHPTRYNGKLIQVRGSFRRTLKWNAIESRNCSDEILVVLPSDPGLDPPAKFQIKEDDAYREFKKSSEEVKGGAASDSFEANLPYKNEIVATFVGRLDSADARSAPGKTETGPGFGPQGQFRTRLVLRSVSRVVVTMR